MPISARFQEVSARVAGAGRVLILAPSKNDARLTAEFLDEAGIETEICGDMMDVHTKLDETCGAALLAEETLFGDSVDLLADALHRQPTWSDIPIAIITSRTEAGHEALRRLGLFAAVSNVVLIERPFRPQTLISTMELALRSRHRQFMTREFLKDARDNAEELEFTLTAGGLGAWKVELETNTLAASNACKAHFGLRAEQDFSYGRFLAALHPDDQRRVVRAIENAIEREMDYQAEYRVVWDDGSVHWISARGRCIYDAKGCAVRLSGVTQDVTEKKNAEMAVRASERRLRLAVDLARLSVYEWEPLTGVLRSDARLKAMWGLPPDAQVDVEIFRAGVHPGDRAMIEERMARAVDPDGDGIYEAEFRVIGINDNIERWVVARGQTSFVKRQPVSYVGGALDITERKRTEQTLREISHRFRFLAESLPQKIFTAEPGGRIDYSNRRLLEYIGREQSWNWNDFVHPDDAAETTRRWQESVVSGVPFELEHRFRDRDGNYRWHLSRAHAMRGQSNEIMSWLGSSTDIEERKRQEEKLEQLVDARTAQLRETVHELEAFSYSISHDMRQPLRAMEGYAQALREDYGEKLNGIGRGYIDRISAAAVRLDRLIADVLTYSRITRADVEVKTIDLDALVRDVVDNYPSLRAAQIEIAPDLGSVRGHEAPLVQCVSNLLDNAVKFASGGPAPTVRIRGEVRPDGFRRLWVEDNGIGIHPRDQERIFNIFTQVHGSNVFEGTGIGLSIVKKAVTRMGGRVGVESALGQGSRFWLDLPPAES
jgi:PAS domain S-box-containing protein